jgi:hypothetical protein
VTTYAREVEAYLCRKNDGHLIRIVGPSFETVRAWEARGVPLTVVFRGIDRHFERYYAKGPRRWPVRIDFCEPDVLDVFDEWRRAVGAWSFTAAAEGEAGVEDEGGDAAPAAPGRSASLPRHLERTAMALSSLAADSGLPEGVRNAVVAAIGAVESVRGRAAGARGAAREALLRDLATADADFLGAVASTLPEAERAQLHEMAAAELTPFRGRMPPAAFGQAVEAATARLVRERFRLPVLSLE